MDFVCFIIYGKFFRIWIIHEYRYAKIAALKPSRVEKPQMRKKNVRFVSVFLAIFFISIPKIILLMCAKPK